MTMPRHIDPPELARPKGYSHGVAVTSGCPLLFVAGQVGWDRNEKIVSDGFAAQFDQALANFMAVVHGAGGTAEGLVSMTVYVTAKDEYLAQTREVGAAWRRHVGRVYPAMALVQVAALVEAGAKVEIQGVVAL